MMNCLKTSTKLAVLAFVVSGLSVHGNAAPGAVAGAKVDSKGGAQAASDKKVADGKVAGAAVVKAAVAKPATVKPAVMPAAAAPVVAPIAAVVPAVKKEEPKIGVKITGQITPEVAFVGGLKPEVKDDERQGYNFGFNNAFVTMAASAKTDSNMTFSGVARLDMARVQNVTTGVDNADPSKPATAKNTNASFPIFTRLYGQVEGAFGRLQFGNLFGSQATSLKGGFDIFYGGYEGLDRLHNPIWNNMFEAPKGAYLSSSGLGSTTYFMPIADPMRANKFIYNSPSFGGFQLTGVFTPRNDESGSTFKYSPDTMSGTGGTNRVQNLWSVVPTFKKKFGDVEIDLMGSYSQGTYVDSAGKAFASEDVFQNPKLWNVSGTIRAKGFEVGGTYMTNGTSLLSKTAIDAKQDSGSGWNAAVAYNFEKSKVGLMYMATKKAVADSDSVGINCFTAYADYKLADGVKVLISENYLTGTQATTENGAKNAGWTDLAAAKARGDTAANVVFLGFDVKF